MSNRDRIARQREEAQAAAREKEETRKARDATGAQKKTRPPANTRLKAVWAIKDGAGEIVATYPYAFKAAAEAEATRLKESAQRDYIVCPHKVPFDS
jgi:hypothetical protein